MPELGAQYLQEEVDAIVYEEDDAEISALDVRRLLERRMGLPMDALLPHKVQIIKAFQKATPRPNPNSWAENVVHVAAAVACSALLRHWYHEPATAWGWCSHALAAWVCSQLVQLAFGAIVLPLWFLGSGLPVSPADRKGYAGEEMHGWLFPHSGEARRVANRRSCGVDHLVYLCQDLEAGVAEVEALTGVRPALGGTHPGLGTRNALLSLGAGTYLELIAPDPAQPEPRRPRPFGLDDGWPDGTLSAFAVHPTAKIRWRDGAEVDRGATIEGLAAAMVIEGHAPPHPKRRVAAMSREAPGGDTVRWRFTSPWHACGALPFVVEWARGTTNSPHQTAPAGCTLRKLTCYSPRAAEAEGLLRKLGLRGLGEGAEGDLGSVEVVEAVSSPRGIGGRAEDPGSRRPPGGYLTAVLDTPNGRVLLGARAGVD